MPLRVKCRCGQEVVLRYSEWVYLLLGVVLLALVLNTVAVLLLYLDRHENHAPPGGAGQTEDARRNGAEAPPDGVNKERSEPTGSSKSAESSNAGPDSGNGSAEKVRTAPRASIPSQETASPLRHLGRPTAAAPRRSLLDQLKLLSPPAAEKSESPGGGDSPSPYRELVEGAPLLRILLLKRTAGRPELMFAWLVDPDPRIRSLAVEQALALERQSAVGERQARPFLLAASDDLRAQPRGRELLERFGLGQKGSRSGVPDAHWNDYRTRAKTLLDVFPECSRLQQLMQTVSRNGGELLLAIDTTQSMEAALVEIKSMVKWLLPTLEWGIPGLRVGVLLYKDGVADTAALSASPSIDVLPLLLGLSAEGGDQPPEGLYPALKAALELGRVGWTPKAEKHIVFLGDAPPPRSDKRAFESLARASHREGGYRVHALGFHPQEGRDKVPYFDDLARSGGGRSVTCDEATLGLEVLVCLLGDDAYDALRVVVPELKRFFGS